MERLWTPWRYAYITNADPGRRRGVPEALDGWPAGEDLGCVFCNMIAAVDWAVANGMDAADAERAAYVLLRGEFCFVCLNTFPYSTGHVMIVPYVHVDSPLKMEERASLEMMMLMRRMEAALRQVYRPDGLNYGMNLGQAGGAGISDHVHMHALPRWDGDTNFMTTIAETRTLPEGLEVTYKKLLGALTSQAT